MNTKLLIVDVSKNLLTSLVSSDLKCDFIFSSSPETISTNFTELTAIIVSENNVHENLEKYLNYKSLYPNMDIMIENVGDSDKLKSLKTLSFDILDADTNKAVQIIKDITNTDVTKINIFGEQDKTLEERLSNIFLSSGIPPHIKGFQFIKEAVKISIKNPDIINHITKKLYPTIALKFQTSSTKVERAIRHAIDVAYSRGKIENINNLYGIKIINKGEKPTNGELIALIADRLMIEYA